MDNAVMSIPEELLSVPDKCLSVHYLDVELQHQTACAPSALPDGGCDN